MSKPEGGAKQDPVARYECLNVDCGFVYQHQPAVTQCPNCSGLKVRWLNFREK